MKKIFSKAWKASKQPRKQRKYKAKAPLHTQRKFLNANLNKELRKKYSRRSFPLRKGDNVNIMRGNFKKQKGKIATVDLTRSRVNIEGIQRAKKDGTKVAVWFNPSNLQIQGLNLEDKERIKSVERTMKKEETAKADEKKESKSEEKKTAKAEGEK